MYYSYTIISLEIDAWPSTAATPIKAIPAPLVILPASHSGYVASEYCLPIIACPAWEMNMAIVGCHCFETARNSNIITVAGSA